jgi:hypothetical protein
MFCPKCGDLLEAGSDGLLECRRGEMGLSADMQRRLVEVFQTRVRRGEDRVLPYKIGGAWWCPGCGVEAREVTRGNLRCLSCNESFAEFVYRLVEVHPHKGR